ncbi:MAG: hypothetical protein FWF62_03530, partial [Candidatus Bathyarchaeota archaeon]|nr:hypothetical protein [Candidatus Termiticorpusculum sp.]
MANVRIVYPRNLNDAIAEVRKISYDARVVRSMASEVFHLCMFIEDIPYFVAGIVKQEMLHNGGSAIIYNDSLNESLENTDMLITGNFAQINNLST